MRGRNWNKEREKAYNKQMKTGMNKRGTGNSKAENLKKKKKKNSSKQVWKWEVQTPVETLHSYSLPIKLCEVMINYLDDWYLGSKATTEMENY